MELPQSANVTTATANRLPSLDLVRGFALLGIGLENLFTIHVQNADFAAYVAQYSGGLNHGILLSLMVLIRSKFYPIFAFVFGVSAALSLPKQGKGYFIKRSNALFWLGLFQVAFIWNGDVLTQYALMGLFLLALSPLSNKVLYSLAFTLLLFSFSGDLWMPQSVANTNAFNNQASVLYTSGSFIEVTKFRIHSFFIETLSWPSLLFLSRIFAFLLLGYAFGRVGRLLAWENKRRIGKAFLLFACTVGLLAAWVHLMGWREEENLKMSLLWAKRLLLTAYFFCLVATYLLFPLVMSQYITFKHVRWLLEKLGQHTLTHYLFQNLLFSFLFYHYGVGLYGKLAPWHLLLIYGIVISFQLWLSSVWSRTGRKGPVEVLLRNWAGKSG